MNKLLFLSYITLLLFPLLFAACQSDDDLSAPESTAAPTITFGTPGSNVGLEWEVGKGKTRADDDIICDKPDNIGVFAYYKKNADPQVFNNQKVLYYYSKEYTAQRFTWDYWTGETNSGVSAWPYTITTDGSQQKEWEKRNYRFVAYSPWAADGVNVTTDDYNFNTVNWAGISEYSDHDYLVAKNIVYVNNTDGACKTQDLVTFDMQHLMARIRFIFKMSEYYRSIRRIVIESVSVTSSGKQNTAAISYKADNSLNTITWSGTTTGAPTTVNLVKEQTGDYDVKTTYADPFTSLYILPRDGFNQLTLTVKYKTYDNTGTKTRDAETTNTVILSDPWNLSAGKYYDLKISIVPDYLYVLSDNDQDFEGWVVVKEP